MDTNHLHIQKLNVWYDKRHVLHDITLRIPNRGITAIIGPSGCGKSTLLKSMNRLLELTHGTRVEGKVIVDDENLYDPQAEVTHIRRKMGLLAQRPQVLPMSIYDNVAYGPRLYESLSRRAMNDLVEKHLRTAGLWDEVHDRLHAPASALSIGQQQRLCLARGLAVEPEILLCDEPTSALDPQSSLYIEQRLQELKNRYAIVLVTHILRQARRIADHIVFLYLGEVIEEGPAEQVLNHPQNEITQRYMSGDIS